MSRTNVAYKTSANPERTQHTHQQQNKTPNISMKKNNSVKLSAPKVLLASISVLLLLCCVIYGKGETNKLYTEISTVNKQVELMQSEKVRMQSEIEEKMALKNVEDYAENVLGLKKIDKSQIEYVKIQSDDIIAIPQEEQNIFVKIKEAFKDLVEYIRG